MTTRLAPNYSVWLWVREIDGNKRDKRWMCGFGRYDGTVWTNEWFVAAVKREIFRQQRLYGLR